MQKEVCASCDFKCISCINAQSVCTQCKGTYFLYFYKKATDNFHLYVYVGKINLMITSSIAKIVILDVNHASQKQVVWFAMKIGFSWMENVCVMWML